MNRRSSINWKAARTLYERGKSAQEIAVLVGLSRQYVLKCLHLEFPDFKARPGRTPKFDINEAIRRRRAGESYREIAEDLGATAPAVYTAIHHGRGALL